MTVLLVDDRDGRILCELDDQEQVLRLLEQFANSTVPEYLCLVEMHERRGTLLGTQTSLTIRPQ